MKKVIAILCLNAFLLSGCYDYTDVENMSYVTAISVDKGVNGQYDYCFQFVNPLSDEGEFVTYTASGESLNAALHSLSEIMTRKISFTHIKLVAVSSAAALDMDSAVEGFDASRFYRPDIVLAVVDGDKASKMFEEVDPSLEGNAARYYDLAFSSENSLSKTVTTVKDYFFNNSCVLPLVKGSSIDGIAIINKGRLIATGDSSDALCYNILTKGTKQSLFANALISAKAPSTHEYWADGNPAVEYNIIVDIAPISTHERVENVQYQLESMLHTFVNKLTKEYKADVLNNRRLFEKHCLTQTEWKNLDWDKYAHNLTVKVKVKTPHTSSGTTSVN